MSHCWCKPIPERGECALSPTGAAQSSQMLHGVSLLPLVGASRLSAQVFSSNTHSQTFSKPHLSVDGVVQFLVCCFLVGLPVPPQKEPGHLWSRNAIQVSISILMFGWLFFCVSVALRGCTVEYKIAKIFYFFLIALQFQIWFDVQILIQWQKRPTEFCKTPAKLPRRWGKNTLHVTVDLWHTIPVLKIDV